MAVYCSVWNTSNYGCLAVGLHLFRRGVSAVSFLGNDRNQLIAVDDEGQLLEFTLTRNIPEDESQGQGPAYFYNIKVLRDRRLSLRSASQHNCRFRALMAQFSEEGDVLARIFHDSARHDPRLRGTSVVITYIRRSFTRDLTVNFENDNIGLPVLSKNGCSLLVSFFSEEDSATENDSRELRSGSEIVVVPELDVRDDNRRRVHLEGERASWGLRGEYLLLWDYDCGRPRLSVYRTADLYSHSNSAALVGQRKLSHALSNWKAQMLEPRNPSVNNDVLICETNHGNRRFLIWSLDKNIVTKELSIRLLQEAQSLLRHHLLPQRSADRVLECDPPARTNDEHLGLVVDDAFLKFCASRDGKWIGAISCCHRSGALSSLKTGATAWSFSSLEPAPTDPFLVPNHVKFDPYQRHFLVFGDNAIHAFAPAFLDSASTSGREMRELNQALRATDSVIQRRRLLDAYQHLPSRALAGTWQMKTRGRQRLLWFQSHRHKERKGIEFVDASLSPTGDLLALIGRRTDGSRFVCTRDAKHCEERRYDEFGGLRFPEAIDRSGKRFLPERVFLYHNSDGSDQMALLEGGHNPVALFCDIVRETTIPVRLGIKTCLQICQTKDLDKIALLGEDGVCILNLAQKQIVDDIPFQVDFNRLMDMVADSVLWYNTEEQRSHGNAARRISDDGTVVLLAWDAKNAKSIVVTPVTEQRECEALIERAEGELSDFCTLCGNGACTAFVEIEDLRKGFITVGFFHEIDQRVMHRLQIDQRLPRSVPEEYIARLLAKVFYELSPDGTQLITRIMELRSSNSGAIIVKDQVKIFGVYAVADCIPNYDILNLRRTTSIEQCLQQLYGKHGFSVFNTPSLSGMTVFQKAFVEKNQQMVQQIINIAKQSGSELSLEWEMPRHGSGNLLKATIDSRSTNDIRDAVELVCSKLVPFRSAALILKHSFKQLAAEYRDILEHVLSNNLLAHEPCRVRVHVDYLNEKRRREDGIHIHTADSCLEWSLATDPKDLEAMWKEKHKEATRLEESSGNKSTTESSLKFVQIEDAAKTGMHGIIRPLLLQKVPEHFFQFDVVKWIIMYKWIKIWQGRFLRQAMFYGLFVAFFTVYTILLSTSASLSDESTERKILNSGILGITFVFAIRMAVEEYRQIATYLRDGEKHFGNKWKGLHHFVRFRWNWLDLLSCLVLLFAIPLFHTLSMFDVNYDEVLSAFVALEAIIASAKVWYFAQPFRVSGALVRMIGNIVNDCLAFLLLGFVILFGFGLALHVLFRHKCDEGEKDSEVDEAFGTFHRSLLTLFYALLGSFDQEVYIGAGSLSWLTVFTFIAYMLAQMIVLLNLLISIMGDTFDRVKSTEEAQMLVGQAQFMDSCEAGLSESEREKINKEIGKYLYVLTGTERESATDSSEQWKGRLNMIEANCRKAISSVEQSIKKALRENKEFIVERMKSLVTRQEQNVLQKTSGLIGQQDEKISSIVSQVEEHLRAVSMRIDRLESKFEESHARLAEQLNTILSHLER